MTETLRRAVTRLAAARDERTDAALIDRFLTHADQPAFAELVRRHGPMVLGACRRFLGPGPDADDAFQATFLVLVRRAGQLPWRASVGAWLYGVAVRVARKARAVRGRRRAAETQVSPMTPEPPAPACEPDDLAAVFDEELAALPEAYRRPLVLCELQGRTRAAAARELGLAEGTLSSRLARGRRMLRDRLARRGVGPASAVAAAVVSADLAEATVRGAVAVQGGAAGAVPAAVWSLTEGVVKTMIATKLKLAGVMTAVGLGLTLAGGTWTGRAAVPVAAAADPPAPAASPPAKPAGDGKAPPTATPKPLDGKQFFERYYGVLNGDGKPMPVATIFGDVPVTREAFGEYLIRRYGRKELEMFVNKQIILQAAGKDYVSRPDNLQAALDADAKALGLTREEFVKDILPKYGKTETTWLEDVIEPRLIMAHLCGEKVKTATEDELRAAFARKYGEKWEGRMILCPSEADAEATFRAVSGSEDAFAAAARSQFNPTLATSGGRFGPIPMAAPADAADAAVHKAAKALRAGEVGKPFKIDGNAYLVLKCDRVIPADTTKSYEREKPLLLPVVLEAKIAQEIPKLFDQLKRQANPKYHLTFGEFPTPVPVPVPSPVKK